MKKIITIVLVLVIAISANAQQNSVRLGLFGLTYGGVNLKYERSLTDNMSIGATVGVLVPRRVKFLETLVNSNAQDSVDLNSKIGGFSIVPEFRIYTQNDGLEGFYVAPAFHYSHNVMNLALANGNDYYKLNSKVNGLGGSVNIGYQWLIGSGFTIDWTIFGLGVNNYFTNTTVNAYDDDLNITQADADNIEADLRSLFLIGNGVKYFNLDADNNKLDVRTSNLIPAVRASFSLGYSF